MRAIVTGGGSGGHIYPALAVAQKIKEREPDSEILFIGNDVGIEKDVVPKTGLPFRMVAARWFEKKPVEMLKTGFVTLKGRGQALNIMKEFRPDVVVGTGGFVCVPVIMAAHRYGCPAYLLEANAFPGKATRVLERYCSKMFLGFDAARSYFKNPDKMVFTGNPVREEFFHPDRAASREKLGLPQDKFVIFTFAGSQGANVMTDVTYDFMKMLNGDPNVILIFVTGTFDHMPVIQKKMAEDRLEVQDNIWIREYIDDMANHIGAADLIIERAGALSIAETCVSGRASILVPAPTVPGNHQFYNAKAVADQGGAVLLEEKDMTPQRLLDEARRFQAHPEELREMEKHAKECAPHDAAERIYECISKL